MDDPEFVRRLSGRDGLDMGVGPFDVRIYSNVGSFAEQLRWFYRDFSIASQRGLPDFHIHIDAARGIRRLWKPQVLFRLDRQVLFEPYPLSAALPLFEWGLNWCIATLAHRYLLLHAAVVCKNGNALILPAFPGSGKSTLCAALVHRGWRLFSDEFGIVRPENGRVIPMPRPIPLKNKSIEVIREFAPAADLGPLFPKTRKGTVAHLRAPTSSIEQMDIDVLPRWIIFPRFQAQAKMVLAPVPRSYALVKLATNAFNYDIQGKQGFLLVRDMIRACECYNLVYNNLDEVVVRLEELNARHEETPTHYFSQIVTR